MSSRVFQLVAGLVLILAALTPLMECFDHWDKHPGPANDTEIRLTAWFVGVGVVLTLAELLRYTPSLTASKQTRCHSCKTPATIHQPESSHVEPTGSPPIPLIAPLRI